MKPHSSKSFNETIFSSFETLLPRFNLGKKHKPSLYLFLALCFNLIIAPVVYAASNSELSRTQAWTLGLLGLGTVLLSVYLFFVIFLPEKF